MNRRTLCIVLAGFALAAAPSAPTPPAGVTAEQWKYTPPTAPQGPAAGALLGRLAMLTGATAGIGLLCLWLVRRSQKLPETTSANPLKLTGRVALGPRCVLHLLEVEEAAFVIGIDTTGIRNVLPLPVSFDRLLGPLEPIEAAPPHSSPAGAAESVAEPRPPSRP